MRFHSIALLTGATAVAAGNTANLLLPGFQGHDLQAGVLSSVSSLFGAIGLPVQKNPLAKNLLRPVLLPPTSSPALRPWLLPPAVFPATA